MTRRLLTCGNEIQPSLLDLAYCVFDEPGFRRIALIVRGVDRKQRRLDLAEAGRGVIVRRRLPLPQEIIGIDTRGSRQSGFDELIGLYARRCLTLVIQCTAGRRDAEKDTDVFH